MRSADVLVVFLVLLLVVDQFVLGRLKLAAEPRPRVRVYGLIMAGHWLATRWAAAIVGLPRLWRISLSSVDAAWLPPTWLLTLLVLGFVCIVLVPAMLARMPGKRTVIERAMARLSYLLPQTCRERLWWVALSITAGVCEECLFRSFLLWYLQGSRWRLGIAASIGVACALFAVGHLYQGLLPALGTGVLAIILFVFFLASGSLLLPIVMHTLADMRVLLMIHDAKEPPPSGT
ncbi:MAG TPA: CPBP family intramembrane glutamic endopeptidase [Candidatus Binatia bacterium]|nr:CPBP family intramembrane glutamic endopeptidase [Candidatus Binatia bacterium]